MNKDQLLKCMVVMLITAFLFLDAAWCADCAMLSPKASLTGNDLQKVFQRTLPEAAIAEKAAPRYEYTNGKIYKTVLRNLFNGEEIVLQRNEIFGDVDITSAGHHFGVTINAAGFFDYIIDEKSVTLVNIRIASHRDQGLGETVCNWLALLAEGKTLKVSDVENPRIVSIVSRVVKNARVISGSLKTPAPLARIPVPIEKVDLLRGVFDVRFSGHAYTITLEDARVVAGNLPHGYEARINEHGYIEILRQGQPVEDCEIRFSRAHDNVIALIEGDPDPVAMSIESDGSLVHYQNNTIIRRVSPQGKILQALNPREAIWRQAKNPKHISVEEEVAYLTQALKTGDIVTKQRAAEMLHHHLRRTGVLSVLIGVLKSNEDDQVKLKVAEALAEKKHTHSIAALYAILDENNADLQTMGWAAYALALAGEKDERIPPLLLGGLPQKNETLTAALVNKKSWRLIPIEKIFRVDSFENKHGALKVTQAI